MAPVVAGVMVLLSAGRPGPARAEPSSAEEYAIKAAYLYQFAKFVEWPEPAGQAVRIGVVGDDPFGRTLDRVVAGKTVQGRPVTIVRRTLDESFDDCQMLFISYSEATRIRQILRRLDRRAVLTISEGERFAQVGGMIAFVLEENRVRFHVNPAAIDRAGLKVSSKLLQVATVVGARR
ncbi:MAG: YfiR family protein [Acidobacteria bacterium]|nr:YfiR family protein [Acidobacteriota bacterium]